MLKLSKLQKLSKLSKTDAFKLVLETTLESPLDSKQSKPVNPKGNQPRKFTGRIWPHDAKSQLIEKDLNAGKD